ncbi:MAG TPA: M50 family metallopeptidase [Nocardioidaceae bacterium]|jgi:membrane-associated protease RseP (regulator of RpoE activity)|nr:M50 family metallopeptidase [Nocardioidaceae bacterium]
MTVLLYTLGVLLFAVGLAVSIGLHEVGHLVTGKMFGVKVTQYFVGFGRTLWSTKRGETEYGVKAVPFGGYVKLVGMLPPGKGQDPQTVRRSNTGMFQQLVSDARAAEYELVEPGDEDRLFYRLSWWKKITVMGAGILTNLVLGFLLFAIVFMVHGVRVPQPTVSHVSDCVIAATAPTADLPQRHCRPSDPVAPAKKAGLQRGDTLVSFNGTRIHSWDQLTNVIRANRDGQATIVVRRDGQLKTLHTNTTVSARPQSAEHPTGIVRVGFLGISPTLTLERKGPGFVVTTMADYTWRTLQAIGQLPAKVVGAGKAALGLQPRSQDSPMSVVGASRVAGQMASDNLIPASDRFFSVLMLLGGVNLFVGVLNIVPLLPLDGGHIAGALFEAVRRGLARLFRRPDPGYFDVAKLLPVAYAMAGVILVVSVILVYADIVAPVPIR